MIKPINPPREKWMAEFNERLPRIVQALREKLDPEKIILFGSWARGDFRESSDVDLVIVKKTDARWIERVLEAANAIPYEELVRYEFDILVYTPDEFLELKNSRRFVREIAQEGKTVYERKWPGKSLSASKSC